MHLSCGVCRSARKAFFSSTSYFFLLRLWFFFFPDLFFRLLLLFLSMHNSSLHQRLFQNPRHILNLRTFIVFCGGLLGGHLKKTTQFFFFFSSHLDLCFLFYWTVIVLPDYLPASHLVTALLGEPAILRHSRRSREWKKVAVKKHDVAEVDSLSRPLSNELKFLCKLPLTIFLA